MRVFAYGSLVGEARLTLSGWRRCWGVAMDNRVAIPGYKVYEDPETGERPPVVVTFLDLVRDPASEVSGVLLDRADLAALDRRERQYERAVIGEGLVAYVGRPEGRARAEKGRNEGIAVIQQAYLELVMELHGSAIPAPDVPVRDLARVDLPNVRQPRL